MGDKLKEIFRNIRNGWNRFKEAITGKSSNELLESGDEVNSNDKKSGVLRGDKQLLNDITKKKKNDPTSFQGFKIAGDFNLGRESGEATKINEIPKVLDEKEKSHNHSNGEVSEQRIKGSLPLTQNKIVRGTILGNSTQEASTENSPQ